MVFTELRVTFGGASRVSDLAVFTWDRVLVGDDGEVVDDVNAPPDIAIEIVSPEQSLAGQMRRGTWYVANGVRIALVVNPADHSVRHFRPGVDAQLLRGSDSIDLAEVLPGFELTVDRLFEALRLR